LSHFAQVNAVHRLLTVWLYPHSVQAKNAFCAAHVKHMYSTDSSPTSWGVRHQGQVR